VAARPRWLRSWTRCRSHSCSRKRWWTSRVKSWQKIFQEE
jgi:hypothetical protein